MKERVLTRKFTESNNNIINKEEVERTINRDDIPMEIRRLTQKEEKLLYMARRIQAQLDQINKEKDVLNGLIEEAK